MVMEVLVHDTAQEQIKGGAEVDGSFPSEIDSKKDNNVGLAPEGHIASSIMENSHGANGVPKDGEHMSSVPKDAVDEWPTPKQIHTFFFVKYRSLEDPKLKAKIEQAEKDIQKKNQARLLLTEALKAKRSERSDVISKLKPLSAEDKEYRMAMDAKIKEMRPLQDALGDMRNANIAAREKGTGLCSSEEELDDIIRSLHYRMQHESLTLNEEKRLLKEIKQLEGTREKVIANAAERAKIQDSLGQKQVLQGQVKLISGDIDEVRKEKQAVKTKISVLENDLNTINQGISSLQEELEAITEKRNQAYETLKELRTAREQMNASYFRNRTLINSAKDLAVKKDIAELQRLSYTEVEKFMSEWSSNKAFREDYEKRILPSLDIRQLSKDGRMRNPDEKPILYEVQVPKEPETTPVKVNAKVAKEDAPPLAQPDGAPFGKGEDDNLSKASRKTQDDNRSKPEEKKLTGKAISPEDSENSFEIEKSQKQLSKSNEIDAAKLKELKREEEIAKAKLALERKKKLAEKAAAKAEVRAQKEAEKKLKEKEKRAKKKAGVSALDALAEETETDTRVAEPEEENVKLDAPVAAKSKEPKENVRYRSKPKNREQISKVMLKRKKSNSHWLWAAPAAAAAVLVLAMLGYYFFFLRK